MKSFKICLDLIPKKITTTPTKMHGTLKTLPTHPLPAHVAQKIAQSLYMNQPPVMKLQSTEVLRLSQMPLDGRITKNTSTKLMSRPQEMSCCQAFLEIAKFPNLTMLKNTKPVLVKLTIIIGHLVLLRQLKSRL